jgi:hypothetical protein
MFNKKKKEDTSNNGETLSLNNDAIIADLLVEEYRFMRSYLSITDRLFDDEKKRYKSTYEFHKKKLAEITKELNLNLVTFDGKDYDVGLPVTPLNTDEFEQSDKLIIEQTIEPTIINNAGVVRLGTVILGLKV